MWQCILIFIVGYLIGSINFSIVVTKYIGKIDIRTVGSGNAGGTNVVRAMGAKWGITVIVLEALKGIVVGLFAKFIFPVNPFALSDLGPEITGSIAVLGVLLGNVFPCWHGFKGGKGVTTCIALIAILNGWSFIILFSLFCVVFLTSRMVSLGSVIASLGMPVAITIVYHDRENWLWLLLIVSIFALTLILRHRTNIKRIFAGTENKFKLWKKD